MILGDPGIVERGFVALDGQVRAGSGGLIDLVAVDASGILALLEIDREGEEKLLARALEHRAWAVEQFQFLRHLYGGIRIHPFRLPRLVLVSHNYSPAFLQKLPELDVPVTPLVYRLLLSRGDLALYVEPAGEPAGEPAWEPAPGEDEFLPEQSEAPAAPERAERLSPEELEAFYRFEALRSGKGSEKDAVEL